MITGYQISSIDRLEEQMVLSSSTQVKHLPMVTYTQLTSAMEPSTNDLVKPLAYKTPLL